MNQTPSIDKTDRSPVDSVLQTLDLLHPPDERAWLALRAFAIPDLKQLYQMLERDYDFADWPRFVWDALSDALECELAALYQIGRRCAGHRHLRPPRTQQCNPTRVSSGFSESKSNL